MAQKEKKEKAPRPYKGVADEIREQHQKMGDMSLKEKIAYFWYYYKVHTIVTIVVAAIAIHFIYGLVTAKDTGFYGIMLNSYMLDGNDMEASFSEYADIDLENYECFIDTDSSFSYQSMSQYDVATNQQIVALVQAKELDAFVLNDQVFYNFAFNSMLMDLRDVFTEEELSKYEGNIYYIDYADIRESEEAELSYEDIMAESAKRREATWEEITAEAESHRNPEDMEQPIPIGIYVGDSPFINKTASYPEKVPIYGISITSQRLDICKKYLNYLFDEEIPFDQMLADPVY